MQHHSAGQEGFFRLGEAMVHAGLAHSTTSKRSRLFYGASRMKSISTRLTLARFNDESNERHDR